MTEDEIVGWHHQLEEHEFEQTQGHRTGKPGVLPFIESQSLTQLSDQTTTVYNTYTHMCYRKRTEKKYQKLIKIFS